MTSTLGIKKIQYPNGTNIATLDSSGSIAFAGASTVAGTLGVTGAITGTLATAAQTNITSVGTLTSFRSTGIDDNADALAMTIDTSERVLIGTTSAVIIGNGGIALKGADGRIDASGGGGPAALFDRRTNDGDIIGLYKAGSTVGSIGVTSGDQIYIGRNTGSQGIKLKNSALLPSSNAGADADNSKDLGTSSARWKDLYLSGGAYIGGTGSSNLLNDYEEGTWTPTIGGTSNSNEPAYGDKHGTYTKIGRMVTVNINITITAVNSLNGTILFKGLPFTTGDNLNSTSLEASGSFAYVQGMSSAISTIEAAANHSQTYFTAYIGSGTSWTTKAALAHSDLANNFGCRATLTYFL